MKSDDNYRVKKNCNQIWLGYWKNFKVLMSRKKSLKGNAQTIEKMEKILSRRANFTMVFFAAKGLIWEANH